MALDDDDDDDDVYVYVYDDDQIVQVVPDALDGRRTCWHKPLLQVS